MVGCALADGWGSVESVDVGRAVGSCCWLCALSSARTCVRIIFISAGRDSACPEGVEIGVCALPRLAEAVVSARVEALLEWRGAWCWRISVACLRVLGPHGIVKKGTFVHCGD